MTVMQTMLPTVGQGALENREATSQASSLVSFSSLCVITTAPYADVDASIGKECRCIDREGTLCCLRKKMRDFVCKISQFSLVNLSAVIGMKNVMMNWIIEATTD